MIFRVTYFGSENSNHCVFILFLKSFCVKQHSIIDILVYAAYPVETGSLFKVSELPRITMTSWWMRWRLKWPASWLFTQRFFSGADQRKHESSASLAFVGGIYRWPVNSPHKGPVMREMFPFDGVIMVCLRTVSLHTLTFHLRHCIDEINQVPCQ